MKLNITMGGLWVELELRVESSPIWIVGDQVDNMKCIKCKWMDNMIGIRSC